MQQRQQQQQQQQQLTIAAIIGVRRRKQQLLLNKSYFVLYRPAIPLLLRKRDRLHTPRKCAWIQVEVAEGGELKAGSFLMNSANLEINASQVIGASPTL
jgi:hypothetical protein